jgi:RhoGEF domain/SOS1/NGEF-like PH domain
MAGAGARGSFNAKAAQNALNSAAGTSPAQSNTAQHVPSARMSMPAGSMSGIVKKQAVSPPSSSSSSQAASSASSGARVPPPSLTTPGSIAPPPSLTTPGAPVRKRSTSAGDRTEAEGNHAKAPGSPVSPRPSAGGANKHRRRSSAGSSADLAAQLTGASQRGAAPPLPPLPNGGAATPPQPPALVPRSPRGGRGRGGRGGRGRGRRGRGGGGARSPPGSPPPLPSVPPPPLPSEVPPSMSPEELEAKREKMMGQRIRVIQEFVMTEAAYVRHLNIIVNKFLMPIRAQQLLPMLEMGALFSNVEIVAMANADLLADLEELVKGADAAEGMLPDVSIGDTFLKHVRELIPIYTPYCLNQSKSVQAFEKVSASKKFSGFAKLVEAAAQDPECEGLPLMSFLIKPVQRLCKYPLLLRELIKATPDSHPDFKPIGEAQRLTQSLVDEVNSSKREAENVNKMLEVTKSLAGADNLKLMMPGRRFVRAGQLVKISVHGKHQTRQFTLFNDLLIYAAKAGVGRKKYQFKGFMKCAEIKLVDIEDTDSLKNAFCVIRQDSIKKKHIIYARDPKEKAEWLADIERVIDEAGGSGAAGSSGGGTSSSGDGGGDDDAVAASSSSVAFQVVSSGIDARAQLAMVDVENRVSGWENDLPGKRWLLREAGPMSIVYADSGGVEVKRHVFVFSDSVLVANRHSDKEFSTKDFSLAKHITIKADTVGGIALSAKGMDSFTLCFESVPEQREWIALLQKAGAVDAAGWGGVSQAVADGKIKVVRVRMLNPALADYGLKDTFKTLSLKPETTVAELEEQMLTKICARINPDDRGTVRAGCEGYHLFEEDQATGVATQLDPDEAPYQRGITQLLFQR